MNKLNIQYYKRGLYICIRLQVSEKNIKTIFIYYELNIGDMYVLNSVHISQKIKMHNI